MENKSNTSSKLLLRTDFICSSETDSLVLSFMLRAAILNIYNNKFAIVVIKALNLVIQIIVLLQENLISNKLVTVKKKKSTKEDSVVEHRKPLVRTKFNVTLLCFSASHEHRGQFFSLKASW